MSGYTKIESTKIIKEKKEFSSDIESQNILRPVYLNDFLGQENIKENLKIFIASSILRNEPIDHILLNGPPGLGKTSLAKIISNELKNQIKIVAAPSLTKTADLASVLTSLKKNDIFFIDEIHRLSKNIEETLYSALEDFKLDIIIGEGVSAKIININLEKFTLIGATTKIGSISKPLRDRFGILFNLELYNIDDLNKIVLASSKKMNISIDKDIAHEISKRSRGTPRIALRLLKRVRDYIVYRDIKNISKDESLKIFELMKIDDFGLDSEDRRYISFLSQNYKERAVGIETIAAALMSEVENITENIEPYLLSIGFLEKTPRGRILTNKALEYIEAFF